MESITAFTSESFDETSTRTDEMVLVDFWAPWCGSCRLLMPTVSALADELSGRVQVAKVDVDEHSTLAARLGVMSIPTLVLYRGGREVTRITGVKNKAALIDLLTPHL